MNEEIFFNELNIFFDHIYVITLQRATDRHNHIQKELKGLNFDFFFGKDKNDFSLADLQSKNIYNEALAKKHHRFGKPMKAGIAGCAWSHALVYEDVIKNNYKKVLVLEDDVVINKNAAHLFADILKQLPRDWELLYFGFINNETAPPNAALKKFFYHIAHFFRTVKYSYKTITNLYPEKVAENIYTSGFHDCTHAYAITNSAAKKLLQLQTPVSFVSDNLLAYAATNKLINGYIILPKIIDHILTRKYKRKAFLCKRVVQNIFKRNRFMRYILFQAYGKKEILHECRFALMQLIHLHLNKRKYFIIIYTDHPEEFKNILENFAYHKIISIDESKIKRWRGSINFVHRVKIMIIKDFFKTHTGSVLYCDSDTYIKKDIHVIFKNIEHGKTYMHTMEGYIDKQLSPSFKKWEKFLNKTDIKFNGEKIKEIAEIEMWNAGVIGMHHSQAKLLDAVLHLTDKIYAEFPKHTVEQFAFSYILQKNTSILAADKLIFHYWNLKEYGTFLNLFFQRNKDPLAVIQKMNFMLPEKILTEKIAFNQKIFLQKIFKKKWDNKYMRAI